MGGHICKLMGGGGSKPEEDNKSKAAPNPQHKSAGAKNRTNETDKALLKLKLQRDALSTHKKKLVKLIETDQGHAVLLLREGKKKYAIFALKKKVHHEKLLETCETAYFKMKK